MDNLFWLNSFILTLCFDFGQRYVDLCQQWFNFECCVQHCIMSVQKNLTKYFDTKSQVKHSKCDLFCLFLNHGALNLEIKYKSLLYRNDTLEPVIVQLNLEQDNLRNC